MEIEIDGWKDGWMGITRYTTRTLHGSAMPGPSQPYLSISICLCTYLYLSTYLEVMGGNPAVLQCGPSLESLGAR